MKYRPNYPEQPFADLDALRKWVYDFAFWYNHVHRHSALRYVTPVQRHTGEDIVLLQQRTTLYLSVKAQRPERWSSQIRNWSHQKTVWLNPSNTTQAPEIRLESSA